MRFVEFQAERFRARVERAEPFVEREENRVLAAFGGGDAIRQRQRRFAYARRADQQCIRAAFETAAEQRIHLRVAART